MPLVKLLQKPGIVYQATLTLNEDAWSRGNLIRWRDGYLEKLMGWVRLFNETVTGIGRTLHAWQDLDFVRYMAIGTNAGLYVYDAGSGLQNVTPVRDSADLTNPFTTVEDDSIVNVTDASHGTVAGDSIFVTTQAAVGGLIIFGEYTVVEVIDANNYTIDAGTPAPTTEASGGTVPVFATTNSSNVVTVTLTGHGLSPGDTFDVLVLTTVATVDIEGTYLVVTVPDDDTFTIETVDSANADDTGAENGGDVQVLYRLAAGPASTTALTGWGTGPYGIGPYGLSTGGTASVPLRYWALDNFGEILLAAPTQGALYEWTPPKGTLNFATVVSGAPSAMNGMFVTMPQAQVVALGAEVMSTQDPLLVRWSDNGSYSDWTASSTNQAGSYRLSRGSTIVGGLQGSQAAYIWTDLDIWQMVYQGPPFVYSFSIIGNSCGLIAPYAAARIGADIFWMTSKGFFIAGTSPVTPIPCSVWDVVFANLDTANQDKCIAAANGPLGEVTWYFPSTAGSGEIDSYVKLNISSGLWDYGLASEGGGLVRTGWTDQNVLGNAMGVDENGRVQQHEIGYDNDDDAMTGVTAESGYSDIEDGTDISFIDQIIPDFLLKGTNPTMAVTLYTVMTPGGTPVAHGPYTVTSTTGIIPVRARGRQAAIKYEMDGENMWFRVGAPRVRVAPSGRQ